MNSFIITGCNAERETALFALLYFNADTGSIKAINLESNYLNDKEYIGFTGITKVRDKYYICVQSFPNSKILICSEDFIVEDCIEFEQNDDLHSIFFDDPFLYVTCTATNKVVKINTLDRSQSIEWEYLGDEKLHLNVFKIINGTRYILMHNSFLSDFKAGALVDIDNNVEIVSGLKNPHDIVVNKGMIYTSSSGKGICYSYSLLTKEVEVLKKFNGYLRGFYIDDDFQAFFLSAKRLYSRKKGVGYKQIDDFNDYYGKVQFESFLRIYNESSNYEKRYNLTAKINEIYDVIRVNKAPAKLYDKNLDVLRAKAFRKRINFLELQLRRADRR